MWRGRRVFKLIIPFSSSIHSEKEINLHGSLHDNLHDNLHGGNERTEKIIKFCQIPRSREEIQELISIKNRDFFRKIILKPLLEEKILKLTIPDKPKSPKQKYYS